MNIGDKIKDLRLSVGLTQEKFGKSIGISRSSLTQIETGKANPTVEILAKIIKLYNVDANDFFSVYNSVSNSVPSDENLNEQKGHDEIINYQRNENDITIPNSSKFHNRSTKFINRIEETEKGNLNRYDFYEFEKKVKKLNHLYQRLIDIKMMRNFMEGLDPEADLVEYIANFSKKKSEYFEDWMFTKSGLISPSLTSDSYKPKNLNDIKDLNSYFKQLDGVIEIIEITFFKEFKEFYTKYLWEYRFGAFKDSE